MVYFLALKGMCPGEEKIAFIKISETKDLENPVFCQNLLEVFEELNNSSEHILAYLPNSKTHKYKIILKANIDYIHDD